MLTALLYVSEVRCLRENLLAKLRSFHNRRCRAMCRITMEHTRRSRILLEQLYRRLGFAAVEQYCRRRLLRWADHVSRMPMDFHGSCLKVSSRTPGQQGLCGDVEAHLEEVTDQV